MVPRILFGPKYPVHVYHSTFPAFHGCVFQRLFPPQEEKVLKQAPVA